jgi:hypothetical protein
MVESRKSYLRGRISTVDLLVLNRFDQSLVRHFDNGWVREVLLKGKDQYS